MDELGDDLLLLAAGSDGRLAIPAKLRFGLAGSELVRLAAPPRTRRSARRLTPPPRPRFPPLPTLPIRPAATAGTAAEAAATTESWRDAGQRTT